MEEWLLLCEDWRILGGFWVERSAAGVLQEEEEERKKYKEQNLLVPSLIIQILAH